MFINIESPTEFTTASSPLLRDIKIKLSKTAYKTAYSVFISCELSMNSGHIDMVLQSLRATL